MRRGLSAVLFEFMQERSEVRYARDGFLSACSIVRLYLCKDAAYLISFTILSLSRLFIYLFVVYLYYLIATLPSDERRSTREVRRIKDMPACARLPIKRCLL